MHRIGRIDVPARVRERELVGDEQLVRVEPQRVAGRRDEVIDYVAGKYGRDRVSQISTYGTMTAKAVVRDVGRVLGYPYGASGA